MSPFARSAWIFGIYLLGLGAGLVLVPELVLQPFGVPTSGEIWIRVVGMLVGFLGYYYVRAALAGLSDFIAWTVPVRWSVIGFFGAFVALGLAPGALLVFGAVDALGATWTWWALRREAKDRTAA